MVREAPTNIYLRFASSTGADFKETTQIIAATPKHVHGPRRRRALLASPTPHFQVNKEHRGLLSASETMGLRAVAEQYRMKRGRNPWGKQRTDSSQDTRSTAPLLPPSTRVISHFYPQSSHGNTMPAGRTQVNPAAAKPGDRCAPRNPQVW